MISGIIFAILSPALYSIVNYFDKFFLERYKIEPLVIAIYSGFLAFCVSILLVLLFGLHIFPFSVTLAIILSGFLTELYIFPYFKALALEEASTVMPLVQFAPLFIIVGDALLLGETLTVLQYIGAFFIITSGMLLSLKRVNTYIFKPRPAFWFMLIACFYLALASLLFKYGVTNQNFWHILPYEGFGIFLCALLILCAPKEYNHFRKHTKQFPKNVFFLMSINEAIFILSRYFGFFALSLISASLVGILAGLQPLFVLLYGIILSLWFPFILKEVITKKTLLIKLLAIVMVMIGVGFLSMQ